MKVHYDKEADALYIHLQEGEYLESEEVEEGVVVDYSRDGKVIGLEILNVRSCLKELEGLRGIFAGLGE